MDRLLWTQKLTKYSSPPWPCSECRKGILTLVPGSLTHKETVWSKRARRHEDWAPDYITYAFTAWVKCSNPLCGDEVAVAGDGGIDQYYNEEGETTHSDSFSPRFCSPMPDFFELPKKCPLKTASEMRAAFALFWSDPSGAANRIRNLCKSILNAEGGGLL